MKIGFYGHSNCSSRSPNSFIDLIASKLNATIINIGVRQGSEERILFELKKTKKLDLAVIFHSDPQYIFLPGCDRDISLHRLKEERIDYLFSVYSSNNQPKFVEKFQDIETFEKFVRSYETYCYHPDLQMNRYYGALIQIDQYITKRNIPTIHIIDKKKIPVWFNFTSGIVDTYTLDIIRNYSNKTQTKDYNNGISIEGNYRLSERLIDLIAACSR